MTDKIIDQKTGEEVDIEEVEMDTLPLLLPSIFVRNSKMLIITAMNEKGQWIRCSIEFERRDVGEKVDDPEKKVEVRLN